MPVSNNLNNRPRNLRNAIQALSCDMAALICRSPYLHCDSSFHFVPTQTASLSRAQCNLTHRFVSVKANAFAVKPKGQNGDLSHTRTEIDSSRQEHGVP